MRFVRVLRIRVQASYCTMSLIHAVRNRTLSPRCTPSIASGKLDGDGVRHFTTAHVFSNLYALGLAGHPKEARRCLSRLSLIAHHINVISKRMATLCPSGEESLCPQDTPFCDHDFICRRNDGMCNNHADCDSYLCGPESAGVGNLKKCLPVDAAANAINQWKGTQYCTNYLGLGPTCEQMCNNYSSSKSVPDSECSRWDCSAAVHSFEKGTCGPRRRDIG